MKRYGFWILAAAMTLVWAVAAPAVADEYTDTIALFRKSPAVKPFFKSAYGYAVFPNVGKGGIGIGGAYGKGRVYRRGKVTGTVSLFKASIGLQLGGQVFSEIIFFKDKRAYEDFTRGNFEFDATASAVAITVGAEARAGTQGTTAGVSTSPGSGKQVAAGYRKGMAVFVHAKGGLMFEAAVGGQKFRFTPK